MELCIGKNIKQLRCQKGITQEMLAEHLHISTAAVSKWERGETLPDISMVIPLASYFGVTTDEILGVNAAKNEEKIQAYLDEYHRLGASGKIHEKYNLMVKAYKEFPNDWRIIEEYMWQLNYDPNCTGPYGNKVHKEELYHLCERVLDECTLDQARYSALSILSGLYAADGQLDKSIETAKRLPDYYMSRNMEIENCYEAGSTQWYQHLRENIWDLMHILQLEIRSAALYANYDDPLEQIRLLKKSVALIKLIFDDSDYGWCHYDLNELYLWIANRYVMTEEYELAFKYYEKGLAHAKKFQELPKLIKYTSFLVREKVQDMTKSSCGSEDNEVKREIDYIRSCETYKKVKDMPEMKSILAKYEPFMGKRTDYSQI